MNDILNWYMHYYSATSTGRKRAFDGTGFDVECDNVINGIGFVPTPVAKNGGHVHTVGDCVATGNLRTVIWRAWDVCMKI